MAETAKTRPGTMRLVDATQYRLPLAGIVSILHRASGALMFVLLPFVVWLFDASVTSEISYARFTNAFVAGIGWLPAWAVKLVVLALIWSFLHHLVAGLRHVWMDVTHSVSKEWGRQSAVVTLVVSLALTLLLGARLFGIY
ncbi:MAG: succinate dehydrogenase, cytochrome b556 subunit [Piscinibacter sp.]|nr:succinate dehydrogenase, cytochrome b556 subunit [Piscinibacter sp.]